jgi:hypothetical protein
MVSVGCISKACKNVYNTNEVSYVRLHTWLETDSESVNLISEKAERSCAFSQYAKELKKIKKKKQRKINRKRGIRSCFEFGSVLSCLLACVVKVDVVER